MKPEPEFKVLYGFSTLRPERCVVLTRDPLTLKMVLWRLWYGFQTVGLLAGFLLCMVILLRGHG